MHVLCPIYNSDIAFRLNTIVIEYLENLKPGQDTENAVVATTGRLSVQVRAHHNWWCAAVFAWPDGKEISHFVK